MANRSAARQIWYVFKLLAKTKGGKGNQTRHGWLKFVLWLGFIFLPK